MIQLQCNPRLGSGGNLEPERTPSVPLVRPSGLASENGVLGMILAHEWQLSVASPIWAQGAPSALCLHPGPSFASFLGTEPVKAVLHGEMPGGSSVQLAGMTGVRWQLEGHPPGVRTLLPAGHHLSGAEVHFPSCHHTLTLLSPSQ